MERQVAVAATGPDAAAAGLSLAADGGNAVDAALASMVVALCTEPGIVSPMGGAFVTVWPPDGEPIVVDGNVEMPGRGRPTDAFGAGMLEVTTPYGGGITLYAGPGSVATPGAFAALGTVHERYGAVPWREVMAPAVDLARDGFRIGAAAAYYLDHVHDTVFAWDPETRAVLRRADGSPVEAGDRVRSPDLATSLEEIARSGWATLYSGELAAAFADDLDARGGLISHADLAAYRAVVRRPVRVPLARWDLATNPPPSVGGPMLALLLEGVTDAGRTDASTLIEVQSRVLEYRKRVHDLSRDLDEDGWALLRLVEERGLASLPSSPNTVHISAVDSDGLACAVTASAGYGSGMTVPGTGLMLNNSLGEPELNRLGLHALAPGTRLASNMAPTVGRSADGELLAVGSPGADRITTALQQVLVAHCLDGIPLQDAIDRARLHVRVDDDGPTVMHEDDVGIAAAVAAKGLQSRVFEPLAMFFGGVGAAHRSADGALLAAADPRREAAVAVG